MESTSRTKKSQTISRKVPSNTIRQALQPWSIFVLVSPSLHFDRHFTKAQLINTFRSSQLGKQQAEPSRDAFSISLESRHFRKDARGLYLQTNRSDSRNKNMEATMKRTKSKLVLSPDQSEELLKRLKDRFERNMSRHEWSLKWAKIEAKLFKNAADGCGHDARVYRSLQ